MQRERRPGAAARRERPLTTLAPTRLEPFTLEHFHSWIDECELELDNGDDWQPEGFQDEIAADIFGDFREIWAILPEGNAKTTLMAGIALYCGDHAVQPWIPIGAASRDQAEIMFGQAAGFVERSAVLKRRFRVYEGYRKIKCLRTGGRGIKVYPWDPRSGDGVIPFPIAFCDELHRHEDLRLYRLWKGKLGKRGGKIAAISTAGDPGSEFEEQRETIRNKAHLRERDGSHLRAVGTKLVYHEWMLGDVKQARDLDAVKGANPLATITTEYLAEKLGSETLDFGEDWLRLTCNIPARSSQVAIPEANWDALETDERIPEGERQLVGADFAFAADTTALVPLWPRDPEFMLLGTPEILTPPRDGTLLDVEEIKAAFTRLNDRNPIDVVVMDKSRAEDIAAWLEHELGVATVIDRTQDNVFAVMDYDRWMEGMRTRALRHTGDRELRRHVLNAIARRMPGDKHRFDRPSTSRNTRAGRQERRVVDALTAASAVFSFAVAELVEDGGVVYA